MALVYHMEKCVNNRKSNMLSLEWIFKGVITREHLTKASQLYLVACCALTQVGVIGY